MGQRRWLATVVWNEALTELRTLRRRREQSLEQLTAAGQEFTGPDADPPEVFDFYWKCAGIRAALEDARDELGKNNYGAGHTTETQLDFSLRLSTARPRGA